jgi:hypothetical protein
MPFGIELIGELRKTVGKGAGGQQKTAREGRFLFVERCFIMLLAFW